MDLNLSLIKIAHNIPEKRFEIDLGKDKAVLIYIIRDELFILLHTEVPPAYEGRGIAGRMAHAALEFAMKEGYKIRSYCSYTTLYIERHPEYLSLLG